MLMLPLEVTGLGGSLSMLLLPHLTEETPVGVESVLAGGNCESSRQLRLDDGGTCPLTVGPADSGNGGAVVVFVQCWISKFVIFVFFSFS
jgi:hypothetical protein